LNKRAYIDQEDSSSNNEPSLLDDCELIEDKSSDGENEEIPLQSSVPSVQPI
jgi:hypothetical protein